MGVSDSTGDFYESDDFFTLPEKPVREGWRCPSCGVCYSPEISSCSCNKYQLTFPQPAPIQPYQPFYPSYPYTTWIVYT